MLDIYTIIFLALAVFIFARLRSVLGQRTGRERPPYDPFSRAESGKPVPADNVVPIATQGAENAPDRTIEATAEKPDRWAGIAEAGTPVAAGLDAIARTEPGFNARHFLNGAKAAYEMIVTAFAAGDRKTLKSLLARDVFDNFASAIGERESRGETTESRFVAIEKSDITHAEVKGSAMQITVRFLSQIVSTTKNKEGEPVPGSPNGMTDITDVWTFARPVGANDPNWKLVATDSG
ncbi:MAG TPA: Tim44/TimA family putative adaptor protein [Xanthobacteraceae bacterium]|nr:Tim44/TimA family putative adaptor protein [Xanthobacteraceae bacterium]